MGKTTLPFTPDDGTQDQGVTEMPGGKERVMSNLEQLIENGLCSLSKGKSYKEWREIMQQDCNWEGNENITIDNLWEICQYVIFTWDMEKQAQKEVNRNE